MTLFSERFPELTQPQMGLYPVVDSLEWLERLMPMDVRIIQLRIKSEFNEAVRQMIKEAVTLSKQFPDCQLFINDHWEAAIEFGAYGVHLGQEDLALADLKRIHQARLRLGISTHDPRELESALYYRPSYLALGHVFPTQTKVMPSQPQGVDALTSQVLRAGGCPTVAIGGITLERAAEVKRTGVDGVAVVTAITEAEDWQFATQQLQEICDAN